MKPTKEDHFGSYINQFNYKTNGILTDFLNFILKHLENEEKYNSVKKIAGDVDFELKGLVEIIDAYL